MTLDDVTSLYIPHSDSIEACKSFMDNGCRSKESIQCISKLMELVFTKNHFQFIVFFMLTIHISLAQLWGLVCRFPTVPCKWENFRRTS